MILLTWHIWLMVWNTIITVFGVANLILIVLSAIAKLTKGDDDNIFVGKLIIDMLVLKDYARKFWLYPR